MHREVNDLVCPGPVLALELDGKTALGASSAEDNRIGLFADNFAVEAIGGEAMPGAGGIGPRRFVRAPVFAGTFDLDCDAPLARCAIEPRIFEPQFRQFQARAPLVFGVAVVDANPGERPRDCIEFGFVADVFGGQNVVGVRVEPPSRACRGVECAAT